MSCILILILTQVWSTDEWKLQDFSSIKELTHNNIIFNSFKKSLSVSVCQYMSAHLSLSVCLSVCMSIWLDGPVHIMYAPTCLYAVCMLYACVNFTVENFNITKKGGTQQFQEGGEIKKGGNDWRRGDRNVSAHYGFIRSLGKSLYKYKYRIF